MTLYAWAGRDCNSPTAYWYISLCAELEGKGTYTPSTTDNHEPWLPLHRPLPLLLFIQIHLQHR